MVTIAIGALIAVVIFFAAAFGYVLFFKKKGRKVTLEFYEEMTPGSWFRIDPHKKYYGLLYRQDGIEKLKIPKKFSKVPLEGVNIKNMIPSNRGIPIILMVKDAEEMYRPVCFDFQDKKTFSAKVEQREPLSWLFQENERIVKRYAKGGFWEKYGAIAMIGMIVIGGMLAIYATGQQINELNDDYREKTLGDIKEQKSYIMDLVNNIKGENNNNVETAQDAQKPLNG